MHFAISCPRKSHMVAASALGIILGTGIRPVLNHLTTPVDDLVSEQEKAVTIDDFFAIMDDLSEDDLSYGVKVAEAAPLEVVLNSLPMIAGSSTDAYIFYQTHGRTGYGETSEGTVACQVLIHNQLESLIDDGKISAVFFEGFDPVRGAEEYVRSYEENRALFSSEQFREAFDGEALKNILSNASTDNVRDTITLQYWQKWWQDGSLEISGWEFPKGSPGYEDRIALNDKMYRLAGMVQEGHDQIDSPRYLEYLELSEEVNEGASRSLPERTVNAYNVPLGITEDFYKEGSLESPNYATVVGSMHMPFMQRFPQYVEAHPTIQGFVCEVRES